MHSTQFPLIQPCRVSITNSSSNSSQVNTHVRPFPSSPIVVVVDVVLQAASKVNDEKLPIKLKQLCLIVRP